MSETKLWSDRITFRADGDNIELVVSEIAFQEREKIIYSSTMPKASAMLLAQHIFDLCGESNKLERLEVLRDEIHTEILHVVGMIEELGEELNGS